MTTITLTTDTNGNTLHVYTEQGVSDSWIAVRYVLGDQLVATYNYKRDVRLLEVLDDLQRFIDTQL